MDPRFGSWNDIMFLNTTTLLLNLPTPTLYNHHRHRHTVKNICCSWGKYTMGIPTQDQRIASVSMPVAITNIYYMFVQNAINTIFDTFNVRPAMYNTENTIERYLAHNILRYIFLKFCLIISQIFFISAFSITKSQIDDNLYIAFCNKTCHIKLDPFSDKYTRIFFREVLMVSLQLSLYLSLYTLYNNEPVMHN